MPLNKRDRDLVRTMIQQLMDTRTNMSNPFKGHTGMDRREDNLVEMFAFSEKEDDESVVLGSYPPVAT